MTAFADAQRDAVPLPPALTGEEFGVLCNSVAGHLAAAERIELGDNHAGRRGLDEASDHRRCAAALARLALYAAHGMGMPSTVAAMLRTVEAGHRATRGCVSAVCAAFDGRAA
jgi:hypothetical protein